MLNCKIKPFLTPIQKYNNRDRCKRSVFFQQELEFTFSPKYLLSVTCWEELSAGNVFPFLGIWASKINKGKQLKSMFCSGYIWQPC